MSRFALTAERVFHSATRPFDGEMLCQHLAVVIEGSRIVDVVERRELDASIPVRDLGAGILVPGFIDLQVNGGAGVLLNATPTLEGVRAIAAAHRRFGTTNILPTVITDAPEVMQSAAAAVSEAIRQGVPGVLGIHIEGPFIDPRRKGAHAEQYIRKPTEADVAWLCGLDCGKVLLTLAPNMVAPNIVRRLADAGVIVSLGHAEATFDEARAALDHGARGFTHLYNAMSQMTGRSPGMVGAALTDLRACSGIIADGHHVDPAALTVAQSATPDGAIFFVSDAMPTAAGGPDHFVLQGRPVHVVGGQLQLEDGTLAGANITLRDAIRYARGEELWPLDECLRMASSFPAHFLRMQNELGRIKAGCRANLVHLIGGLDVLETWIDGTSSKAD